ncbi:MAG: flagellin [Henriciella sp.]|uniref:flagellin n=1 Tax=Henriciella sp. TaxID=1968823 RepID=UPI003C779E13
MIRNALPMSVLTSKISQSTAKLREQIKDTGSEAVTGRVSDITKHLSGRVGQAMLGKKAIDDLSNEMSLLQLRKSRLDISQQSLSHIQTSISGLTVRAFDAVNFSNDSEIATTARDAGLALEGMLSTLNARHGERFLFAGDATSTAPFEGADQLLADVEAIAAAATDAADLEASLDTYFNDPAGDWQQNIYKGAQTASDSEATLAIDPALTQIVRGLSVLAISQPGGSVDALGDSDTVRLSAANRLSAGETALTDLRATIGIDQKRIADRTLDLEKEEITLVEAYALMTGRDQYEAASALKVLEANLEASYLLTARLSNLSLLNFLR